MPEALRGYSDPQTYAKADRYDNLDLFKNPILKKILTAGLYAKMPDGNQLPINDSTFSQKYPYQRAEMDYFWFPTKENEELLASLAPQNFQGTEYALFRRPPELRLSEDENSISKYRESSVRPGPCWAILRTGENKDEAAAVVGYGSIHSGHNHYSTLNLIYYDFGKEMLTDLGYLAWAHPNRPWLISPLAHNLVIVDGKRQSRKTHPLLEAFSGKGRIKALIASDNDAFKNTTEKYRRYVILADHGIGKRYLVDLFSVKGGKDHQYAFHADGETFIPPQANYKDIDGGTLGKKDAGYSWLKEAKSTKISAPFVCEWISAPKAKLGTRLWMAGNDKTELIYAKAPGLRNRKTPLAKKDLYPIIVRRPGNDNKFLSAIECFKGKPEIKKIRELETQTSKGWAKAIEISMENRKDIIAVADDEASKGEITLTEYPAFSFSGRICAISLNGNKPEFLWMLGGKKLKWNDCVLEGTPEYSGIILKVDKEKSSVITNLAIKPERKLDYGYMFVNKYKDGAYKIREIKNSNGDSVIEMPPGEILNIKPGDKFKIVPSCSANFK